MATVIIAEAGVNHNGSIDRARELIDVAADAGADYVKFQTFKAEKLVTRTAGKAEYQKELTASNQSQFEMIKKLELDRDAHNLLIDHCKIRKISFLSTAFDHDSIDLLFELDIPLYKIPSGEITNLPYLRHVGGIGRPIIMSTGMSTLNEVEAAIDVLLKAGAVREDITVLHCNSEYPTPASDVNLNAMITMRDQLKVAVGYSDHTSGIEFPIAAVSLGASVIEKHFTLDRTLPGPDHAASLEPHELCAMIKSIRNIELGLGNGEKQLSPSERPNLNIARKSIVARMCIKKGEAFTNDNLAVKRPGTGMSPMIWDRLLGEFSSQDYEPDDLIEEILDDN